MADNQPKKRQGKEKTRERRDGEGKRPKIWTQRVFSNTLILSCWWFLERPLLALDPVAGKSDSPSQSVKEKTANQLNRNWNLFPSSPFSPPSPEGHHSVLKYTLDIIWQAILFC